MGGSHGLAQLVLRAAARTPEAVAVVGPDETLSYAVLDDRAARLAAVLATAGVGKGDRVGLWLPKSSAAIVAMQAVLRLGAVYVPIDPESPAQRARKIVLDAGARALVCAGDRRSPLHAEDPAIACVDASVDDPRRFEGAVAVDPEDLAYILYTSGSTGTPKGVALSHRAALAFVDWAQRTVCATADDRFASHAPLHFDLSVLDLYAAFAVGARVCLIPAGLAYAPAQLVAFIRKHAISIWYSVPSALILMIEHGGLLELDAGAVPRVILFAGEPFPIKQLRRLRECFVDARLLNLYGPTETNVCTAYEVAAIDPERTTPVPIGQPCCGDEAWALTESGARARVGETGELWVRGPTVMTGYWGQAPLGEHAYATGDIVRVLEHDEFEYVGRRDHMVKVRGMRIEIGEIEAALLEDPRIAEVAVVVTGAGMSARLVAFVRGHDGGGRISLLSVKRHCAERLPRYMIIDELRVVAELPRTGTGKLDRRTLVATANSKPKTEDG